jgi:hypothetical protein
MNDLDRDLREMFHRREGDVRVPSTTPPPVVRRTKRRQLGTVVTAAALVVALAATVVASSALLRGGDHSVPGDQTDGGMRTTTSSYATATYPSTWLATVDGPDMAMTNFDPGLGGEFCERIAGTMPPDGVALLILPDPAMAGAPAWPISLAPDRSPGPCGAGPGVRSATWIAPNGMSYRAIANAGPQARAADVAALGSIFGNLTFPSGPGPAIDDTVSERVGVPGLVLESGSVDGQPWNLVAFPDKFGSIMLEVEQSSAFSGGAQRVPTSALDPGAVQTHVAFLVAESGTHDSRTVGAVVYGTVGDEAASAEVLGSGPQAVSTPARIFTAPPSLRMDSRLVVGSVEGPVRLAYAIAYDANGSDLGRESTSPGEPAGPTPEIDAAWNLLRQARNELSGYAAKQPFDELRIVATIDSNIDYLVSGDPPHGRPDVGGVTVRVDDDRHLVALTRVETGEIYCVGIEMSEGGGANFRYGSLNALTYGDCSGGWS